MTKPRPHVFISSAALYTFDIGQAALYTMYGQPFTIDPQSANKELELSCRGICIYTLLTLEYCPGNGHFYVV